MDVRTKFALSMAGLVLLIIVLLVAIYFVANDTFLSEDTSSPLPETRIDTPSQSTAGFNSILGDTEDEEADGAEVDTTAAEPLPEPEVILTNPQEPEEEERDTDLIVFPDSPGERIYTVTMYASWNKNIHGDWYPRGAHLSPMVAWTHGKPGNTIYTIGESASLGMESMAETGSTRRLEQEIKALQSEGFITDYAIGKRIDAPGEDQIRIRIARHTPSISVVSMIAPSPDWFVTAKNITLYENGNWVRRKRHTALIYDAGTDSGTTFNARNDDTNPKELISLIPNQPAIGIVTFEFNHIY